MSHAPPNKHRSGKVAENGYCIASHALAMPYHQLVQAIGGRRGLLCPQPVFVRVRLSSSLSQDLGSSGSSRLRDEIRGPGTWCRYERTSRLCRDLCARSLRYAEQAQIALWPDRSSGSDEGELAKVAHVSGDRYRKVHGERQYRPKSPR